MMVDTEELAQMLYDASLTAKAVPVSKAMPFIRIATPGHPALEEPTKYRWFLIKKFPVSNFEYTLQDIIDEVGSQSTDDVSRHNKIVEILHRGGEEFPVIATAEGVLLDGYHRIAAHDTLRINKIPVLVAVTKPGRDEQSWDEQWNHNFPIGKEPKANPTPFDAAMKAFPSCIAGGLDSPKTVSDLVYQALHELDMFEEGQDGAISAREAALVRKFVQKFRTTEMR